MSVFENTVSVCVSPDSVFDHVFMDAEVSIGIEVLVSIFVIFDKASSGPPVVFVLESIWDAGFVLV